MRRLKQLNSADLNDVRLVSNIRQRQSNIRQKFNWCFKRRNFHAPNTTHQLCLFTWSPQTVFFCTVDSNAMCRKSSVVRQFIMASTSTSCISCFKSTKYTRLDCSSYYCITLNQVSSTWTVVRSFVNYILLCVSFCNKTSLERFTN